MRSHSVLARRVPSKYDRFTLIHEGGILMPDRSSFVHVALVGDYNPLVVAHRAIPQALELAAKEIQADVRLDWISSHSLASSGLPISKFDAIWCIPGSPYKNMDGVLPAITHARKSRIPLLGTCGGFQHVLIEYARNVLQLSECDHLESNPNALIPFISPLACSLVGTKGTIFLQEGSRIQKIYQQTQIVEPFHCNFGVNPKYQYLLEKESLLKISGVDASGNIRIVELDNHPFFVGTLYQPERSALQEISHPLIREFLRVANLLKL